MSSAWLQTGWEWSFVNGLKTVQQWWAAVLLQSKRNVFIRWVISLLYHWRFLLDFIALMWFRRRSSSVCFCEPNHRASMQSSSELKLLCTSNTNTVRNASFHTQMRDALQTKHAKCQPLEQCLYKMRFMILVKEIWSVCLCKEPEVSQLCLIWSIFSFLFSSSLPWNNNSQQLWQACGFCSPWCWFIEHWLVEYLNEYWLTSSVSSLSLQCIDSFLVKQIRDGCKISVQMVSSLFNAKPASSEVLANGICFFGLEHLFSFYASYLKGLSVTSSLSQNAKHSETELRYCLKSALNSGCDVVFF